MTGPVHPEAELFSFDPTQIPVPILQKNTHRLSSYQSRMPALVWPLSFWKLLE